MKFYYVDGDFYGTLAEARASARYAAKDSYDEILVCRVNISTDRRNILRLANNGGGIMTSEATVYTAKPKLKKGN